MHSEGIPWGYGFWSLVVVNAAIFVLLALSYLTPVKQREWRSFGVFTGFVVALFTEMARREERDAEAQFGDAYRRYKAQVPMFVPRLWSTLEPRWSER